MKEISVGKTDLEKRGIKEIIDLSGIYETLCSLEVNIYNINKLQDLYNDHRKKSNDDKLFLKNINKFYYESDENKKFIESAMRSVAEIINFVPVYGDYQALTYDNNSNLIFDIRYNEQDNANYLFQTFFPLWIKENLVIARSTLKTVKNTPLIVKLEKNNSPNSLFLNKIYLIVLMTFGVNVLCTAGGIYWIYKQKEKSTKKITIS